MLFSMGQMKAVKNIESNRTPTELFVGHWVYLLIVRNSEREKMRINLDRIHIHYSYSTIDQNGLTHYLNW